MHKVKMNNRFPLVVILGATGSGKTKLSLELAKKFGGEIIGADSMQLYKALDIITAKATKEEQRVAPHHLIDILEPNETFTVIEYRNKALKIIDDLLCKKSLPIVVGGTNYYIESLLWKILVEPPDSSKPVKPWDPTNKDYELPSEELHKKLKLLDPGMAKRLHPNNKRKILRSLEVLEQRGVRHSDILKEQQSSRGGSSSGGGLRYYDNALVLWLQCEQATLESRLNARVDTMIEQGLVEELLNFHKIFNKSRLNSDIPDYTKGIFQSIGFKEFHSFLMLDDDQKQTAEGKKLFQEGVDKLKLVTRRYAKKQIRWINNRFLGRSDREVPPVYGLDTTEVSKWEENVTKRAFNIVQSFIEGVEPKYQKLPLITNSKSSPNSQDDTFECRICQRVFIGSFQWEIHLNSRKHKKMQSGKNPEIINKL